MVLSVNMIHISPFACTTGLLRGASSVLCTGGRLILYGPFKIGKALHAIRPKSARLSVRWSTYVREQCSF